MPEFANVDLLRGANGRMRDQRRFAFIFPDTLPCVLYLRQSLATINGLRLTSLEQLPVMVINGARYTKVLMHFRFIFTDGYVWCHCASYHDHSFPDADRR